MPSISNEELLSKLLQTHNSSSTSSSFNEVTTQYQNLEQEKFLKEIELLNFKKKVLEKKEEYWSLMVENAKLENAALKTNCAQIVKKFTMKKLHTNLLSNYYCLLCKSSLSSS